MATQTVEATVIGVQKISINWMKSRQQLWCVSKS